MRVRIVIVLAVVAATALPAGTALAGCGASVTSPTSSSASAQAHNQADITFAQGMIPHHAQAVGMSAMAAQRAASPQVKGLAARIQAAQQPEIDQMSGWLRAWNAAVPSTNSSMEHTGQMDHGAGGAVHGMMSEDQMQQLGQASGDAFDRMFLQMMIIHHRGAVTMAQTELTDGQYPDARQLARRIIDAQQREITEMQALLGR